MACASNALVVVTCLIGPIAAAHAECHPTALASGDPSLVVRLSERLAANGVATVAIPGCPVARVRVEPRGEQIHIEITDDYGRTGSRDVGDLATAATVVESWTSREIDAGSIPPVIETPRPAAVAVAVVATRSRARRLAATTAFESSAGSDGTIWFGGMVAGCARIGPLCVGGLVRGALDANAIPDPIVDYDLAELSAYATVGLPRRIGRFTITPGVGLGYGWRRLTEHHVDLQMVAFDQVFTRTAARAELHLGVAYPLGHGLSLCSEVRGDAIVPSETQAGPRGFVRVSIGVCLAAF